MDSRFKTSDTDSIYIKTGMKRTQLRQAVDLDMIIIYKNHLLV